MTRFILILTVLISLAGTATAEVQLARIFTDHMVLQQELPIAIWGTAAAGEKVIVTFNQKTVSTNADQQGQWRVDIPKMKADGRVHQLVVQGKNVITLKDILLGEVWIASGQSNMSRSTQVKEDNPNLRVFWKTTVPGVIPHQKDFAKQDKVGWSACSPAELAKTPPLLIRGREVKRTMYGEVAYIFGRQLQKKLKVPVGIIHTAWGGSTAKSWTPKPGIEKKYPFEKKVEGRYLAHVDGLMYQVNLHPIAPYTVRGVIWYQGEDDGRNKHYTKEFTEMIQSWRKIWKQDKMPFYFAQIGQTTYASGMLGVLESQVEVMQQLPNTALAPSVTLFDKMKGRSGIRIDQGNQRQTGTGWPISGGSNPHPPNKHIVAIRLANIALAKTYQVIDREVFGPMYHSHEVKDGKIIVKFKHAGQGLISDDGKPLNWFELSDGSKKSDRGNAQIIYVKANAKLVGQDIVEISTPKMKNPKYVRFAWHTLARPNLFNQIKTDDQEKKLPAISFRTDKLPQMWNRR